MRGLFGTSSVRLMFVSMLIVLRVAAGFAQSRQSQSEVPAPPVPLAEILEKADDRVQQYTTNVQRVACTELTRQLEVEPDLKTVKKKPIELVYDLIIIPGTGFGIREQRELKLIDGKPVAKNAQPPDIIQRARTDFDVAGICGIVPSHSRIPRSTPSHHAFVYQLPAVFE
jgi:hypothetical protein